MKTVIIELSCIPLLSAVEKSAETAIIYSSKGSFKKTHYSKGKNIWTHCSTQTTCHNASCVIQPNTRREIILMMHLAQDHAGCLWVEFVCTKYCRMPRLSPFSRLNALNLICFATLDWYLPKHNSAWKLVLQENAPSGPLAFRRWSLVHHKVWKKTCIWNRKSVSFLRCLGGWVTRVAVWAGIPKLPSPSSLLQLYQGDPEVFPGQPRDIVPRPISEERKFLSTACN